MEAVALRIRPWPWSVPQKSHLWVKGSPLQFEYFGSPIIEVASQVRLFLPARHENFIRLSEGYRAQDGMRLLYEAPHGVLSGSGDKAHDPKILLRGHDKTCTVDMFPDGAAPRVQNHDKTDSELAATVLSWSQFFDDCFDYCHDSATVHSWNDLTWFKDYLNEADEPRMALIVCIAREMEKQMEHIVQQARKVLVRERVLLPAGRIDETDTACLQWYIRQPGTTTAQKAAANRQTLLGVARKETYDTLENRVLKAFIALCFKESRRYLKREERSIEQIRTSKRGKSVHRLQHLCTGLEHHPTLEAVAELHGRVQPNYVLQNDLRYREVWSNYTRLLRKEDEEDRLWDWQTRTWADVVRLLCHAALCTVPGVQLLRQSQVAFRKEQLLGSRVQHTEPGPFLIQIPAKRKWVMEVVHPEQLHNHPQTAQLARLAGQLYCVLRKLDSDEVRVVVIWAVHTIASTRTIDWEFVSQDAAEALQRHMDIISDSFDTPPVKALVAASVVGSTDVDIEITRTGVPVLLLPADPVCWKGQLENFGALLITQIEEAAQ